MRNWSKVRAAPAARLFFSFDLSNSHSRCLCRRRWQSSLIRPGQTLATFQRNTLQHFYMMLQQVLNGLAKRTQRFPARPATSGPSALALMQQCCTNVAKRVQQSYIMQRAKCCTKNLTVFKFDPTSSNMLHHIATRWANVCYMLCPTMLQDSALKCCN